MILCSSKTFPPKLPPILSGGPVPPWPPCRSQRDTQQIKQKVLGGMINVLGVTGYGAVKLKS